MKKKKSFLLQKDQLNSYNKILKEDGKFIVGEKAVVLVVDENNQLSQEEIRTWNQLIPAYISNLIPEFARFTIDGKHFPRMDDKVKLWLEGKEIVGEGHFHVYGEKPSTGDLIAQRFSLNDQFVIANGVVPRIYFNGSLVTYNSDIVVLDHVMKIMRGQQSIFPEELGFQNLSKEDRINAVKSFLGFLKNYHGVDINDINEIQSWLKDKLSDFKEEYGTIFNKGFNPKSYSDPNISNFLDTINALDSFAYIYKPSPSYLMKDYGREYYRMFKGLEVELELADEDFNYFKSDDYSDTTKANSKDYISMIYRDVNCFIDGFLADSQLINSSNFVLDFSLPEDISKSNIVGGVLDLTTYQINGNLPSLEISIDNKNISFDIKESRDGRIKVILPPHLFEKYQSGLEDKLDIKVNVKDGGQIVFYSPYHKDDCLVPKLGVIYSN